MAQGKPQLKFERNPCSNFRDNRCHRRTDDGRQTTDDGRILISWKSVTYLFSSCAVHFHIQKRIECNFVQSVISHHQWVTANMLHIHSLLRFLMSTNTDKHIFVLLTLDNARPSKQQSYLQRNMFRELPSKIKWFIYILSWYLKFWCVLHRRSRLVGAWSDGSSKIFWDCGTSKQQGYAYL